MNRSYLRFKRKTTKRLRFGCFQFISTYSSGVLIPSAKCLRRIYLVYICFELRSIQAKTNKLLLKKCRYMNSWCPCSFLDPCFTSSWCIQFESSLHCYEQHKGRHRNEEAWKVGFVDQPIVSRARHRSKTAPQPELPVSLRYSSSSSWAATATLYFWSSKSCHFPLEEVLPMKIHISGCRHCQSKFVLFIHRFWHLRHEVRVGSDFFIIVMC